MRTRPHEFQHCGHDASIAPAVHRTASHRLEIHSGRFSHPNNYVSASSLPPAELIYAAIRSAPSHSTHIIFPCQIHGGEKHSQRKNQIDAARLSDHGNSRHQPRFHRQAYTSLTNNGGSLMRSKMFFANTCVRSLTKNEIRKIFGDEGTRLT